jgi:hypothetical protein
MDTKDSNSNSSLSVELATELDNIKYDLSDVRIVDAEVDRLDNELEKELQHEENKKKRRKLVFDHRIQQNRGKFSEKMHERYDIPARNKLIDILGDFIVEHPNPYKQDFIITSKTCKYKYLEVQVCSQWVNEIYPFENLWVWARKSVYNSDTLFITLNKSFKYGFIFDADSFKNVKKRRLKKYSREFVYDIPWNKIMKVSIDKLDKETIELY